MKFLISTANYFSESDTDSLLDNLDALAVQNKSHSFFVQVFDNSQSYIFKKKYSNIEIELLKPKFNLGLAPTWKISLNKLKSNGFDVAILVNNDTEFTDSFFDSVSSAISDDSSSVYGAFICLPNGEPWSTGGQFGLLPWVIKHEANNTSYYKENKIKTSHVSGCCIIMPKNIIINNEGIFSGLSDFFFRGEEWFVNKRLQQHGIDRYVLRNAVLIHKENGSHVRFSAAHIYWAIRAKMLFIKKLPTISKNISMVTYSLYIYTRGFLFYKKNSDLSCVKLFFSIHKAWRDGLSKRVVRSYNLK